MWITLGAFCIGSGHVHYCIFECACSADGFPVVVLDSTLSVHATVWWNVTLSLSFSEMLWVWKSNANSPVATDPWYKIDLWCKYVQGMLLVACLPLPCILRTFCFWVVHASALSVHSYTCGHNSHSNLEQSVPSLHMKWFASHSFTAVLTVLLRHFYIINTDSCEVWCFC